MLTDHSIPNVTAGHSAAWHMHRAKQLQAEAVRAGVMAAMTSIKSLFSNRKTAISANRSDAGLVCGHV